MISMNLRDYDIILVNTSAGKDSQAMMDLVFRMAREQGLSERLVAVHADLGRMEWSGTRELAEEHAKHYGIRFISVRRRTAAGIEQDLLTQVEARGMWPSNTTRYCTSDHKRAPIRTVMTALVSQWREEHGSTRRVRLLNCMGFRAEESPARAKRQALAISTASNGKREVTDWLPIHNFTLAEVWNTNGAAGTRHHYAYDLGMPRLSCVFCIFCPEAGLMIAGKHNPELLADYAGVETRTGHQFTQTISLVQIQAKLNTGIAVPTKVTEWSKCA